MNDLRQLLRYEIPGLIAFAYFLVLSYPLLVKLGNNLKIDLVQIIIVPIMALPIGFLLFQLYTSFEHENFLKNRDGIKAVTRILEKYPCLEIEKNWWEENEENIARRNEILDTVFYKNKKDSAKVLERFESFYHSRRVVGIYSPIAASLAVVMTAYFFSIISWGNLFVIGVFFAFFVLISYWKRIWEIIDNLCEFLYIVPYSLIIGIHVCYAGRLAGLPHFQLIFLVSLILIISGVMIIPTRKKGALRKVMDNFEENIVLSEINEIIKVIRNHLEFSMPQQKGSTKQTVEKTSREFEERFIFLLVAVVLSVFFGYLAFTTETDNTDAWNYILSSISQGLAALLALVVTLTFVVSQILQPSGEVEKSKPIILLTSTIYLISLYGSSILISLLSLQSPSELKVDWCIALAGICIFSLLPYLASVSRELKTPTSEKMDKEKKK